MRKDQFFFYRRLWMTRGKTVLQSFRTNSSIPSHRICFVFSQIRKTSAITKWKTHTTTVSLLRPYKIVMKTKPPIHIMVFGLSRVMLTLCFHSSSQMVSDYIDASIRYMEREVLPGSIYWLMEDPTSDERTLHHATSARESSLGCQKIFLRPHYLWYLAAKYPRMQSPWLFSGGDG